MQPNFNHKIDKLNNQNKFDFDWNDTNEFTKENNLSDNKQRNKIFIGNSNNKNVMKNIIMPNDQSTRMTNFKPKNYIFQEKNNFNISSGRSNNGFYRSYNNLNNMKFNHRNKNDISSPLNKADDILFIPCINCNQLIKIEQIEQHSEICVAYSTNIDNNTNQNVPQKFSLNQNLISETKVFTNNNLLETNENYSKIYKNTNNYFQGEASNNTGKFGLSKKNTFFNTKNFIPNEISNQKNNLLMNSNSNFNIDNNFDKHNEFDNHRLSNYSNNLVINANSLMKNEAAAGFSSNLNSFLDLISENEKTLNSNRNNIKSKFSNEDLIFRNRVINEKLNKILCQINEVEFRMNINTFEEHYIISIENYLLESIKFGNIDSVSVEGNLDKINKNYVNIEALMISFNGSININIILKKVKELLQEKVKIMKFFHKNNNNNTMEKSKSRISRSDIDALEIELKKKKEICDKINFEKELALIKVKNLKKSVIDTNRKTADKKSIKHSKQNNKSCNFIDNIIENISLEPRLTYQNKVSNKDVIIDITKKNTPNFKNHIQDIIYENPTNNENQELKAMIEDISFNKPNINLVKNKNIEIELVSNNLERDNINSQKNHINNNVNNSIDNFRQSTNIKDKNTLKNNLKSEIEEEKFQNNNVKTKECLKEPILKNDYEDHIINKKILGSNKLGNMEELKKNHEFNIVAKEEKNAENLNSKETAILNNSNIKNNMHIKEIFEFNIDIDKNVNSKVNESLNNISISKIEKLDNINYNFELSKDMIKENIDPNKRQLNQNKKNNNIQAENDINSIFKKSNFSQDKIMDYDDSNKVSTRSNKRNENISSDNIFRKKKRNDESKSSYETEIFIEDPEYIKEMKELYKLFKKNLLKIKFEKFPNDENCNKKHLNLKFPEREIFNNLLKQNIPEEEWYDYIYEEILNYNYLETLKSEDNQHNRINNSKKN